MADEDLNMSLHQETVREEQHVLDDGDFYINENVKRLMLNLQNEWLQEYKLSRERALVEITETLHQNFLTDQQRIRTDLLTQFKEELDQTRRVMEDDYKETLQMELRKLEEKHNEELAIIKKKQWCFNCSAEAIYFCCWNTAYCSTACQESHWSSHRRLCRRKSKK